MEEYARSLEMLEIRKEKLDEELTDDDARAEALADQPGVLLTLDLDVARQQRHDGGQLDVLTVHVLRVG